MQLCISYTYICIHIYTRLKQDQITKLMLSFEVGTEAFEMLEVEVYIYVFIYLFISICLYSVY